MGIWSSLKKSWKIRQLSKQLAPSNSMDESIKQSILALRGNNEEDIKKERAKGELFDFIEKDPDLAGVLIKHRANRATLEQIYAYLKCSASLWARGHYIPVSALCFGATLDYILKNQEKIDL